MYELRIQITSEPPAAEKNQCRKSRGQVYPFAGGRSGSDATETKNTVAEHFCGHGKALPELLSDAVRYTSGNVTH